MVPCIFWERGKSYTCVIHSYTLLTSHFPILSHLGFQEHKLPARYLKLRPGENFEGCNRTVEDLHWITWDNGESVIGCEWLVYVLHCKMAIWGIWCTSFQELQMHTYAWRISFSGSKKQLLKLCTQDCDNRHGDETLIFASVRSIIIHSGQRGL